MKYMFQEVHRLKEEAKECGKFRLWALLKYMECFLEKGSDGTRKRARELLLQRAQVQSPALT